VADSRIGTEPIYTNSLGQPIYWIDGAPQGSRTENQTYLLVLHHTAGSDSRRWLAGDAPNTVSATYLVGAYADTQYRPRIYKYMSERTKVPYTQGFGSIGGLRPAMNTHCISIEVEGPGPITEANPLGFSSDLLGTTATLAASILADWHNTRGRSLLVVGHDHIDRYDRKGRHTDPHYDWTKMLQMIYSRLPALTGNVKGWGR
jgi:hypothetical protein